MGSGISGLAAAHQLNGQADVTLFEAGDYFGGHTHTVDVTLPTPHGEVTHGVDTGFLVFNERTYPNLIALLAELNVPTAKSDMSFSVQVPGARRGRPLEWSGTSLSSLFAQRGNLVNPRFLGMLRDLLRFNALTTRIALANEEAALVRLVLFAHAGLYLELPNGPDAAVSGCHRDSLLPQPWLEPGQQSAPVAYGHGWCAELR